MKVVSDMSNPESLVSEHRFSDPQVVVMGSIKHGEKSDIIVFKVPLALFELVCIVTIPEEGAKSAPVYIKFRVNKQQ